LANSAGQVSGHLSPPASRPDTLRVWPLTPEGPMSLKPTPIGPVPELTAYVARAAFPDGNPYMSVRDALSAGAQNRFYRIFDDRRFPGGVWL
jgi:hypothetical protein